MTTLSTDEITRRAQDLVYQVAYAFYDSPYILLLKLLVQLGVANERSLAELVGINPNELRRYMGMLLVHRLVKRYVNKEKQLVSNWQPRAVRGETTDSQGLRVRDVHYWYLDFREFANVVKYRLAMMRKGVDERVKNESGHRGYICPNCARTYDPLDAAHLFDPQQNTFNCESCGTELAEHDPTTDPSLAGGQDRMGRFNLATAPIRDALRSVEGITLPSVNVVAWIAQNVKTLTTLDMDGQGGDEMIGNKKFQVVLGDEGDERERLDKERLAEAQRAQNSLPVWHTHSTVTGSATTLGLNGHKRNSSGNFDGKDSGLNGKEGDDAALADHYARLAEQGLVPTVKREPGLEDEEADLDMEELEDVRLASGTIADAVQRVTVAGVEKAIDDVTEEDQELMSPEEYQAYYEAMSGT